MGQVKTVWEQRHGESLDIKIVWLALMIQSTLVIECHNVTLSCSLHLAALGEETPSIGWGCLATCDLDSGQQFEFLGMAYSCR